ncbi:hypothetical protein GXW82_04150 [Streptacidiphilus sp. 4-A2]|nr:hypothetical protein [Streptacidiphilus sp. 4-A2]
MRSGPAASSRRLLTERRAAPRGHPRPRPGRFGRDVRCTSPPTASALERTAPRRGCLVLEWTDVAPVASGSGCAPGYGSPACCTRSRHRRPGKAAGAPSGELVFGASSTWSIRAGCWRPSRIRWPGRGRLLIHLAEDHQDRWPR